LRVSTLAPPRADLSALLDLTQRAGSDPMLAQASTGNSSAKLNGILWVKASGKWMADALRDDIFIPLPLAEIRECLRQGVDPATEYPAASLETAMHGALPHRVVLHVHCVNTIARAVRADASDQLGRLLRGLHWQWIPYVASGLPLSRAIEQTLSRRPDRNVFVLGNHGLVIGGASAEAVEDLLADVVRRLSIRARQALPADYAALLEISTDSPWDLPDDDAVHCLGTDIVSQKILAGGFLYPCQAIFSNATSADLFQPIPYYDLLDCPSIRYCNRPFLIVEGRGALISKSAQPSELAMLSGLAEIVQRLDASAPLRISDRRRGRGHLRTRPLQLPGACRSESLSHKRWCQLG